MLQYNSWTQYNLRFPSRYKTLKLKNMHQKVSGEASLSYKLAVLNKNFIL